MFPLPFLHKGVAPFPWSSWSSFSAPLPVLQYLLWDTAVWSHHGFVQRHCDIDSFTFDPFPNITWNPATPFYSCHTLDQHRAMHQKPKFFIQVNHGLPRTQQWIHEVELPCLSVHLQLLYSLACLGNKTTSSCFTLLSYNPNFISNTMFSNKGSSPIQLR